MQHRRIASPKRNSSAGHAVTAPGRRTCRAQPVTAGLALHAQPREKKPAASSRRRSHLRRWNSVGGPRARRRGYADVLIGMSQARRGYSANLRLPGALASSSTWRRRPAATRRPTRLALWRAVSQDESQRPPSHPPRDLLAEGVVVRDSMSSSSSIAMPETSHSSSPATIECLWRETEWRVRANGSPRTRAGICGPATILKFDQSSFETDRVTGEAITKRGQSPVARTNVLRRCHKPDPATALDGSASSSIGDNRPRDGETNEPRAVLPRGVRSSTRIACGRHCGTSTGAARRTCGSVSRSSSRATGAVARRVPRRRRSIRRRCGTRSTTSCRWRDRARTWAGTGGCRRASDRAGVSSSSGLLRKPRTRCEPRMPGLQCPRWSN